MKPKPKQQVTKPAHPSGPETMRVVFSQPGVRSSPAVRGMIDDLRQRFSLRDAEFTRSSGYFDKRVTLTCDVPVYLLPSALVHFTRSNGHASTSVGPWLLDTEEPK